MGDNEGASSDGDVVLGVIGGVASLVAFVLGCLAQMPRIASGTSQGLSQSINSKESGHSYSGFWQESSGGNVCENNKTIMWGETSLMLHCCRAFIVTALVCGLVCIPIFFVQIDNKGNDIACAVMGSFFGLSFLVGAILMTIEFCQIRGLHLTWAGYFIWIGAICAMGVMILGILLPAL